MSRIGKKPIPVPNGVTVTLTQEGVSVAGAKGNLTISVPKVLSVHNENNSLTVVRSTEAASPLHGLYRTLIANAVSGVSTGWSKKLELVGVGYRAALSGVNLVLTVGFSHPVTIVPPPGITLAVVDNTKISVAGSDKYTVGEVAAQIRRVRPPEPYKGKGIRYEGEVIRKKAGKAAKGVGAAAGVKAGK